VRDGAARSADDYCAAGLGLLAKGGPEAVTIANLCARLRVTKGSFYHHFGGRADFIRKLLRYWERDYNARLRADVLRLPARQRVPLLQKGALLQQDVDRAIRQLSRSDRHAAAVQRRVDRARELGLARTFREMGMPAERASRLAGIGMALAVGSQQLEKRVDKRRFAALVAEYRRWVEASAPRGG
jgi:AcrR family transcriptional regulator